MVWSQSRGILTHFRALSRCDLDAVGIRPGNPKPANSGRCGRHLGYLSDFIFDPRSGRVISLLVLISEELDPALLPWPVKKGLLEVPVEEVAEISNAIRLRQ